MPCAPSQVGDLESGFASCFPYNILLYITYKVFWEQNVSSKHPVSKIQAIGSWNTCPKFGLRSHFWMDIADFLDAQTDTLDHCYESGKADCTKNELPT